MLKMQKPECHMWLNLILKENEFLDEKEILSVEKICHRLNHAPEFLLSCKPLAHL